MAKQERCPECGSMELIEDPSTEEIFCRNCGLVVKEVVVDTSQEWRAFDHEQMAARARAGAPLTFSVDYEEPIVIKRNDKLEVVKIGELVDSLIEKSGSIKEGILEIANIETQDIEVLSFDENYKVCFKKITEVSRHPVEKIFEIELETGKKVKVTPSHSLFSIENNKVVKKCVNELKSGDFIIAPLRIPSASFISELDLIEELSKLNLKNLYVRNLEDNVFEFVKLLKPKIDRRKIKDWKRRKSLPLSVYSKMRKIFKIDESNLRVGIYSSKVTLPGKIKIDKNFVRLIGLYVAGGNCRKYDLIFTFGNFERALINEVKKSVEDIFGIKCSEYNHLSSIQVQVRSRLLSILFGEILKLGKVAKQKTIPSLIFNLNEELKKEFLKSYLEGDGHYYVNEEVKLSQLGFSTSSKELAERLSIFCSGMGININLASATIPQHQIFTGQAIKETISHFGKVTSAEKILNLGFKLDFGKGKSLENLLPAPLNYKKEWKGRKRIRITRKLAEKIALKYKDSQLLKLSQSDFIFLRVKKIKEVEPSSIYAYDLTVPGTQSFGGKIFFHNTKHDKGLTTEIGKGLGELYKVPSRKRAQYYRIAKWQKRLICSKDRNLSFAFSELQRIVSFLGLPKTVHERIARYYEEAVNKGLVRGRSIEAMIAALTYAVCRMCHTPRTFDEIAEASGISQHEIGRTYRYIARYLNIRIVPADPKDFVPRFCSELKLSEKVQAKTIQILKEAECKEVTAGKGPAGVAAAAIYIASVLCNERRTQREISTTCGITEVTIRNRYLEIARALGLEKEIEEREKV